MLTNNQNGLKWVDEMVALCHPDQVVWIDGSEAQLNELRAQATETKEMIPLNVTGVKYFKSMAILRFDQFDNVDQVIPYKGKDLLVTRENAVPLEEGEYFIADILGSTVITDKGEEFGALADVIQTGANDVFVVKTSEEKEVLLPVIDECELDIDLENKIVKVHIMKGLLD